MQKCTTAVDDEPLVCPHCSGFGSLADDRGPASPRGQECPDCRGRGYLRCEDCGEPATRTAVGDAHIKLCAECGERDDREAATEYARQQDAREAANLETEEDRLGLRSMWGAL